jgi:hypothetical protein
MLLILEEQLNGTKMVIPCGSRGKALNILYMLANTMSENNALQQRNKQYATLVQTHYNTVKHRTILYIDRDGIKLYKTNGMFHEATVYPNDEVYVNLDAFIKLHKIDTFIYTPTITTGISINEPHFDKSYAVSSNRSINYKEFIQMVMRTRVLLQNKSNIHMESNHFKVNQVQVTVESVLNSQIVRAKLINEIITTPHERDSNDGIVPNDLLIELEQLNNNDIHRLKTQHYCICQIINMMNLKHTVDNFTFNIIQVLNYHQLNYHYSTRVSVLEDGCLSLIHNKCAQADINYEKWSQIPILPYDVYITEELRHVFTTKSKPILYDMYPMTTYFEEPSEDLTDAFWKTKRLYYLFKMYNSQCKIITDVNALMLDPTAEDLQAIHTLLTTQFPNGEKLTRLCDDAFNDEMKRYSMRSIWKDYIHNKAYNKVYALRGFIEDKLATLESKTFTDKDTLRLNPHILKTICEIFNIDLLHPTLLTLTNQEFNDNVAKIYERTPSIYNYLKDVSVEVKLKPTDSLFIKAMYSCIKSLLREWVDYILCYKDTKHTARPSDKIIICPYCLTDKARWIHYNVNEEVKPYTSFQDRNPHILLLHPNPINFDKVEVLDQARHDELIVLLENGKKVKQADTLALYKTQMIHGYANYHLLKSNELIEKWILQTYYHCPFYYMSFHSNANTYDHTYPTSRQRKKTITIPLTRSTVSQFIQQDDCYKKIEPEIITRPYDHTELVIKTLRKKKEKTVIKEFIVDFIDNLLDRVCMRPSDINKPKLEKLNVEA